MHLFIIKTIFPDSKLKKKINAPPVAFKLQSCRLLLKPLIIGKQLGLFTSIIVILNIRYISYHILHLERNDFIAHKLDNCANFGKTSKLLAKI
jgi:hypothetical protein